MPGKLPKNVGNNADSENINNTEMSGDNTNNEVESNELPEKGVADTEQTEGLEQGSAEQSPMDLNVKYPFGDFTEKDTKNTKGRRRSKEIVIIEKEDSVERKIKVFDVKRREEKREKEDISKKKKPECIKTEAADIGSEPIYASINKQKPTEHKDMSPETSDEVYDNELGDLQSPPLDEPSEPDDIYAEIYIPHEESPSPPEPYNNEPSATPPGDPKAANNDDICTPPPRSRKFIGAVPVNGKDDDVDTFPTHEVVSTLM